MLDWDGLRPPVVDSSAMMDESYGGQHSQFGVWVEEAEEKSTPKTTGHPPIQTAQNLKKV